MTRDASLVTDDEVAGLKAAYGEEKLVAMVLLLATANFQDRLILALGIAPRGRGGRCRRSTCGSTPKAPTPPVPAARNPADRHGPAEPRRSTTPSGREFDFDALQKRPRRPAGERRSHPRPDVGRGPEAAARRDIRSPRARSGSRWRLVCLGYQPELAAAWSACTRAFGEEAKQDRVFEESLFWVVTRTIHCFY